MIFGKKRENETFIDDWQLYENGKEYHRSLGLYEKASLNERFYRGDQWQGITTNGLPSPVFNIFKRVVDYYVSNILSDSAALRYSFEAPMEYGESGVRSAFIEEAEKLCNAVADHRWEKDKIGSKLADALKDAALSGDGVAYVYWDKDVKTGQPFGGDFRTVLLDNTNVFFGNPNISDVQKQPYILISGRETVEDVKKTAKRAGADEHTLRQIVSDRDTDGQSGELGAAELEGTKCVTIIKLFKGENGNIFRKSVKGAVVIPDTDLGIGLYPICFFNWTKVKNCWHGEPAATGLAENQVFINKGYAMMMKHMMDTAFSKVVYDATVIDEWTNRVGEAIAVNGSVDNVARVLTGGSMQSGMLEVVNLAITHTKEFLGATDTALGNIDPRNTSAIIAVQQASAMPLQNIRRQLHQFIEDLGLIWLEFMIAYYDELRVVPSGDGGWKGFTLKKELAGMLRSCRVDVGASTQWSEISALNTLDNLLSRGHISLKQYLERIPDGIVPKKSELIEEIERSEEVD